jgi:release factor glutamine methyltransferase
MGREREAGEFAGLAVRDVLRRLTLRLEGSEIESPAVDARRLAAAVLGGSTIDLLRDPDRLVSAAEADSLESYAERRLNHEPVSRILGKRGFFGRDFIVTSATLDPRPCSETLIEAVLTIGAEEGWARKPVRVLDIGTGTGCLALTLLTELASATGVATDISREALDVARINAAQLGLLDRVEFQERRFLDGIGGVFEVLISNPPYISSGDIAGLEAEVREFDPRLALDGGADGLEAYRELAKGLIDVLPNGWAFFEIGAGQAQDVAAILKQEVPASADIRHFRDLGGHVRCVAVKTHKLP